ncbi:MAG: galactose oxidase-like domain-containing protein [Planctomycetota bacterium]
MWSPNGDLIVVGGTKFDVSLTQFAARTVFALDPRQASALGNSTLYPGEAGLWVEHFEQLEHVRYYPTATLTHRLNRTNQKEVVLVLGGDTVLNGNPAQNPTWNTYEGVQVTGLVTPNSTGLTKDSITAGSTVIETFAGPGAVGISDDFLHFYPRAHLLTTGEVFFSAFAPLSARLNHESPGTWSFLAGHTPAVPAPPGVWGRPRAYGASVRYPNLGGLDNAIARIGGTELNTMSPLPHTTNTVEICQADSTNPMAPGAQWFSGPSLNQPRVTLNTVILPDASLLALGGANVYQIDPDISIPLRTPEHFVAGTSSWTELTWAPARSDHAYHSTAMLLPDGRVLLAGGDLRQIDYEIFTPPYFLPDQGPEIEIPIQPQNVTIVGVAPDPTDDAFHLSYGGTFTALCDALPFGVAVQKVVLMAPGSTTHHSDMCQRYHELVVVPKAPNRIGFTMPPDDRTLPRGFYMLFLMTNTGVPAHAIWVRL